MKETAFLKHIQAFNQSIKWVNKCSQLQKLPSNVLFFQLQLKLGHLQSKWEVQKSNENTLKRMSWWIRRYLREIFRLVIGAIKRLLILWQIKLILRVLQIWVQIPSSIIIVETVNLIKPGKAHLIIWTQ